MFKDFKTCLAALPYGTYSGLPIPIYLILFEVKIWGNVWLKRIFFVLYATNFPVAYVKRVPGIAFVVFSSFLGKSRSADKKISSGAPFIICA